MRRGIKLTLASLIILAAGAALYLSLVPIDLSEHSSRIEEFVYERTGNRVVSESIQLKVLPTPDIRLGSVTIFEEDMEVLKTGSMRLEISILPLVLRKVVIKKLAIEDFTLSVNRDAEGEINLYPIYERMRKRERKPLIKVLSIKRGTVFFADQMPGKESAFEVTDIEGTLEKPYEGLLRYDLSARLQPGTDVSVRGESKMEEDAYSHSGELTARDVEIARFMPYAPAKDLALKGRFDIVSSYTYGKEAEALASITMRDVSLRYSGLIEEPVSCSGDVTVKFSGNEVLSVVLDRMDVEVEGFDVLGRAEFIGKGDALESVSLNIKTTEIPLDKFKDLVPYRVLDERTSKALKDLRPAGGGFAVKEFRLKGPIGKELFKKADVSAEVELRKLRFRYGNLREDFSGISGRVSFSEDTLAFKGIAGSYGSGVIKNFSGELRNLDETPSYDLSVDAFFDVEKTMDILKEVLASREDGIKKTLEETKATGLVTAELSASGRGAKTPALSGTLSFERLSLDHPSLPVQVKALNGVVAFDGRKAYVREFSGADSHDSTFNVKGIVSDYRDTPVFDLSVSGGIRKETVSHLAKRPLEEAAFKTLPYSARISGRSDSLSINAFTDLTGVELQYGNAVKKPADYPATVDSSLSVGKDGILIKKLNARLKGSSVEAEGNLSRDLKAYSLRVSTRGINLSDVAAISPYFEGTAAAGGRITGKMRVSKAAGRTPSYDGEFRLEEGRFAAAFLPRPVERMNLEGFLKGNAASITLKNLDVGGSTLSGRVDLTDISARKVEFDIASTSFYLGDFLKKREKARTDRPAPGAKKVTGKGRLNIKEGRAWRINFKDLESDIRIEDAVVRADAKFKMSEGSLNTRLSVYRGLDQPLLFDLDATFFDVQTGSLIRELGAKEEIISGIMKGKAQISCKRGVKAPGCLNGNINVTVERGKMWKYLVISKVFSIVNIISIDELLKDGLPYKSLGADFTVSDGVLSTKNVIFDSDSMRMSAIVDINMPAKVIDGTMGVHPFVTIDKIISTIPLAGWVLAGKEKATVSMYYRITGPLKNPDVDPAPIKGIQEGIFGKLQRLLGLPLSILNGN